MATRENCNEISDLNLMIELNLLQTVDRLQWYINDKDVVHTTLSCLN